MFTIYIGRIKQEVPFFLLDSGGGASFFKNKQLDPSIEIQETNRKVWSSAGSQDLYGELKLPLMLYDFSNKRNCFCENGLLFWEEQKQSPPILGSTFFANNNWTLDDNSYMLTTGTLKNKKCFPIVFSGKQFKYTTPLNISHVEERIAPYYF